MINCAKETGFGGLNGRQYTRAPLTARQKLENERSSKAITGLASAQIAAKRLREVGCTILHVSVDGNRPRITIAEPPKSARLKGERISAEYGGRVHTLREAIVHGCRVRWGC